MAVGLLAVLIASGCSSSTHDDKGTAADPGSAASSRSGPDDPAGSDGQDGAGDGSKSAKEKGKGQSAQNVGLDDSDAGKPTRDGLQKDVFSEVPGNKTGDCVDVGSARDIRSGSFVGGAFDEARAQFGKKAPGRKAGQIRLYWIPMHAKGLRGVTVKVTQLSTGKSSTVRQTRVADADLWKFYDTMVTVDSAGRWRFEVSSGKDRGCFEADFG